LLNNNSFEENIVKNCLKKDILDYQTYVKSHIKQFHEINKKIVETLQGNINKINNNYKAKLYGSRATNLCLMWSDVDIVIYYEKRKKILTNEISKEVEEIEEDIDNIEEDRNDFLDKLNMILNNDLLFVENIKYLNKAKVPIIKIKTTKEYNNTLVDITLQTKEHFGLKCVNLIKGFLNEYESLEPLLFPLKTILKVGELNDPYNGGLSSYALILMIVNFFEFRKKMNKSIKIDDIGEIFYDFLFFYGGRKDTNYIDLNGSKNSNNSMQLCKNCLVFIADPLNKNNNVGKTSYKYIEVKLIFLIALQILNEPCFCHCHFNIDDTCKNKEEHNFLNKIFFGIKRGKLNYFSLNK
jgi:non-canonical poly(A) RNA polymerase PAPD5/7